MRIHIVQKGDTLRKIAQKYQVDFEELKRMNAHLSNPDAVMPGMKIKVPTGGVPVRKEGQNQQVDVNIYSKKEEPKQQGEPNVDVQEDVTNNPNLKNIPETPKGGVQEPIAPGAQEEGTAPTTPTTPAGDMKGGGQPPQKGLQKAVHVSPLTNTVPPYSPHGGMFNVGGMESQIPPKPANILPDIMKGDQEFESPAEENKMAGTGGEQPLQIPQVPQMPPTPYASPQQGLGNFYQHPQPYMPVHPVMPGYGGYNYPPAPMTPTGYQQQQPYREENVPGAFEDESPDFSPEVPNLPPNLGAADINQQAPVNVPPVQQPYATPTLPYVNCVPVTPVMPGYGFCPPYYQPYVPTGPFHYGHPVTQPYSVPMQGAPFAYDQPVTYPYSSPAPAVPGGFSTQQIGGMQPNMPMYGPMQTPGYSSASQPYFSQRPPYNPFSMSSEYGESSEYED